MLYLSQLLGAPVEDSQGERIGKINDLLTSQGAATSATVLLVEGQDDQSWRIPAGAVETHANTFRLRIPMQQLTLESLDLLPQEISLAQEVLDKQVIDLARKRAVRVNDVCLSDDWHILGIDNSTLGLVRRLAPSWLLGTQTRRPPTNLIPWQQIELIGTQQPAEEISADIQPEILTKMPRVQSGQLAELRPADIADIVHQLTPGQGARLIEGLDDETAADALEEIDTERQSHILENIRADRAADILEAMEPDEAADLLAKLPQERAQELLSLMTPEESEDVQDLLEYSENSAGGLMTTDYIALNATTSVADALQTMRLHVLEQHIHAAYAYCVADESQDECALLGVVSIWDLLVADPAQSLQDIMETDLITVQPDADPQSVAELMAKYNLLAVPVVTPQGFLQGVVTVDDALDVLLPDERRRKPTRMY